MLRIKNLTAIPLICVIAACSNTGASYQPVIDGAVGPNYSSDLAQCQALASQQGAVTNNAGAQALTGAAVAGGSMAVFDNKGTNARDAALIGAAAGLAGSALEQNNRKEQIIKNCMRQRGYNVVG